MNPYDPHDEDEVRYTEQDTPYEAWWAQQAHEVLQRTGYLADSTLAASIARFRAARIALSKVQEAEAGHFQEWENEMKGGS